MKKVTKPKLAVGTETVRALRLTETDLAKINGGCSPPPTSGRLTCGCLLW